MSDNIMQVNDEIIHNELRDLVRNTVEDALNVMLDAEANRLGKNLRKILDSTVSSGSRP